MGEGLLIGDIILAQEWKAGLAIVVLVRLVQGGLDVLILQFILSLETLGDLLIPG